MTATADTPEVRRSVRRAIMTLYQGTPPVWDPLLTEEEAWRSWFRAWRPGLLLPGEEL